MSAADRSAATTYDQDRAAILSTAVGIARLRLQGGDAAGALEVLDSACDKTDKLHREFLRGEGYTEEAINGFLGAKP